MIDYFSVGEDFVGLIQSVSETRGDFVGIKTHYLEERPVVRVKACTQVV
jgi:hypothetical protein